MVLVLIIVIYKIHHKLRLRKEIVMVCKLKETKNEKIINRLHMSFTTNFQ